jgi:carboxypeptidase Taq
MPAETYEKDRNLNAEIERGDFTPLRTWLRDKIYSSGDHIPTEDLITRVTGKGLDVSSYFKHIAVKFG